MQESTSKRKGGWPKGKPRKPVTVSPEVILNELTQVAQDNGEYDMKDPISDKLAHALKEEELLAFFIRNQRSLGKAKDQIISAWTTLKTTLSADNIDLHIAEEKLKVIVAENRASLGYDKQEIVKMLSMAVERTRA